MLSTSIFFPVPYSLSRIPTKLNPPSQSVSSGMKRLVRRVTGTYSMPAPVAAMPSFGGNALDTCLKEVRSKDVYGLESSIVSVRTLSYRGLPYTPLTWVQSKHTLRSILVVHHTAAVHQKTVRFELPDSVSVVQSESSLPSAR